MGMYAKDAATARKIWMSLNDMHPRSWVYRALEDMYEAWEKERVGGTEDRLGAMSKLSVT